MAESYDDAISMALGELINRACSEQRETDDALDERIKKQAETAQNVEAFLAGLSDGDRALLERYFSEDGSINAQKMEYLYIQGAKDFILLMKKLGAF